MEKLNRDPGSDPKSKTPTPRRGGPNALLLVGVLLIIGLLLFSQRSVKRSVIEDYYFFLDQIEQGKVQSVELHGSEDAYGTFKDPPPLEPEFDSSGKPVANRKPLEKHFLVRLLQTEAAQTDLNRLLKEHG
ncbi:MAG TPA: ATP-dependent metallopeptidase FtsH/Yme1/Tma family protein, partial [Pirellulaceae bacterium]|nr:ATP-dependent metallopeptidase FtsH/Yme1/Tma family protein [Pirellulaceae bacterium]